VAQARRAGGITDVDWLAQAVLQAPVAVAVFDRDLRCVRATESFAALLGYAPSEPVLGARVEVVFGPVDGARIVPLLREALSSGRRSDADVRAPGLDGREHWLQCTCFPVSVGGNGDSGEDREAAGVVLVDVTGRRAAEQPHVTLQRMTAEFSASVTPEAVADVVIRAVCEAVGASGGALYLLDDAEARLVAIRAGYPWPQGNAFREVACTAAFPVAEALRERRPVWIEDEQDLRSRFPDTLAHATGDTWGGHAALPLDVGGSPLGAMVFSWTPGTRIGPDERSLLEAVAIQCAQALHRATLFQRERAAREHTERVADHVLRLERITGALAGASEPEEVVDRFLDQCLAELGASNGAVFEIDPRQGALVPLGSHASAAWEPRTVPLDSSGPLAEAVRQRASVLFGDRSEIMSVLGDAVPVPVADDSWAALPLVAYGETLGAIALQYEGARTFDVDDRAFLYRVGRRLAEALERSRLYAHQRDAREQAEAAARWLRSVQSLAAALARSATRRDVARALREHLQPATRADYSIVAALGADRRSLDVLTGRSSFAVSTEQIGVSVQGAVRESILRGRSIELDDADAIAATFPGLASSGLSSFALLPIRAGRSVIGVIGMGWTRAAALTPDARRLLAIAVSLGGAAFERAAAYDLDHHIAETLQRHLLTEPVLALPGISWAARYAPGNVELTAGGDWYDVIELPGGRVALVVGDIVGHGIVAAAAMGQLRSATRALAVREEPVGVLEALDAYVATTGQGHLSSLAIAVLDPADGSVEYAVAGHPPPLQRGPDGTAVLVEDARGPLLGIGTPGSRRSVRSRVPPGSTLVLYTDGLVERRGESIDEGLARLAASVRDAGPDMHPEALCDRLLDQLLVGGTAPDDITLLVLAFEPVTRRRELSFPARLEMLRVVRSELRSWLDANGVEPAVASDIVLACDEACANAVEHGASSGGQDTIDLTLSADDDEVVLSIADAGAWLESGLVAEQPHGLQIMEALMSEVQVTSGAHGTTVTMRRRRSRQA
jgi:serine/threonine-protein kinase RsbW